MEERDRLGERHFKRKFRRKGKVADDKKRNEIGKMGRETK